MDPLQSVRYGHWDAGRVQLERRSRTWRQEVEGWSCWRSYRVDRGKDVVAAAAAVVVAAAAHHRLVLVAAEKVYLHQTHAVAGRSRRSVAVAMHMLDGAVVEEDIAAAGGDHQIQRHAEIAAARTGKSLCDMTAVALEPAIEDVVVGDAVAVAGPTGRLRKSCWAGNPLRCSQILGSTCRSWMEP